MRIVCGTDLSEQAAPALAAGAAIARRMKGSELSLVHVVDVEGLGLDAAEAPTLCDAARTVLAREAERVGAESGLRITTEVSLGKAVETILEVADAKKADLLVVASRGKGGASLLRLGGTAERIAAESRVPVVVVRDAAPFEAWGKGERPLKMLVSYDWSRTCEPAVRFVKAFRQAGDVDVAFGHVYYAVDARRRYGLPPKKSLVDPDPEAERLLLRDMQAGIGELGGSGQVLYRVMLGLGRIGDHVLHLAGVEQADVIVVGTHKRSGLGRWVSVSSIALHYSHASVMVAPTGAAAAAAEELPVFRRVVVATDLSDESNRAVPYAYALLDGPGGEVFLLHVVKGKSRVKRDKEAEVATALRALIPKAAEARGAISRTAVIPGPDIARAICEAAERFGADAICVATIGRSAVARAVLGSVAEALLRTSRVPVFVLRPPRA
jgi:nucleotide-binding universal stress UspA family protein